MLCKIAGLYVQVPRLGNMEQRCRSYQAEEACTPDIVIDAALYETARWPGVDFDSVCHMEACRQFYWQLPKFDGLMLHASALEYDGKAYLFSGPSTVGKSTHAGLWKTLLADVTFLNDDKPALRLQDGIWYASGTPWCGKDGINTNKTAPLAGICFLKQAQHNAIRRLSPREAMVRVLFQSTKHIPDPALVSRLLGLVDSLVQTVPVYELENTPTLEAARLSFQTMKERENG